MTTIETAALLGVTPAILRAWEQEYTFPRSVFPDGGRRRFARREVTALRAALTDTASVAQAIAHARAMIDRRRPPGSNGDHRHGDGPTRLEAS